MAVVTRRNTKAKKARCSSNNVNQNSTSTSLSRSEKSHALHGYVEKLVKKKENSSLSNNRIQNHVYEHTLKKIHRTGMRWLSLNALKLRVNKAFNKQLENDYDNVVNPPPPDTTSISSHNNVTSISQPTLGRPVGTSYKKKKELSFTFAEAKNDITKQYYEAVLESKKNILQGKVKEGTYKRIFDKVVKQYNLPRTFKFGYHSVKRRIARGVLEYGDNYSRSPLHNAEFKFVQILLSLADIGVPLSMGQGMALIQSLIQGTPAQSKLIDLQRKIIAGRKTSPKNPTSLGKVSRSYYYGFLSRFNDILESNKGRRFELNRTKWTNYRNFLHMYMDVEKLMVDARLATKLDEPVWVNEQNETVSEIESYGCKVQT